MNKRFICAALLSIFVSSRALASNCRDSAWQFSKLDIEASDVGYLETVMGFSYGPEVAHYIPNLKRADSNMFYVETKAKPLITYLTAEFTSSGVAQKAFEHLKSKWASNIHNQYDVFKKGNSVTWFGNNRLSATCFQRVVSEEKDKLAKK